MNNPYHGVRAECDFLKRLGKCSIAGRCHSRRHLLEGYLRGLDQRVVGFDAHQLATLRDYAQIMLRSEG